MRKALKIFTIILVSLAILLGAAFYFIAHSIDPNKIKTQISSLILSKTGRTLAINGELSWSFFPWIGFRIQNVSLSNPANFSANTTFANLKEADVSVRLLPLLSGKIQIRNISFDGLQVNLVRNAQGQTNWSEWKVGNAIATSTSTTTENKSQNTTSNELSLNVSIADFTIVHSQVNYDDASTKQHISVNNLYLEGTNVGTQQLFPLNFSFDLSAPYFAKPLAVNFNGNFNIDGNLQTFAINQIDLTMDKIELQGNLSAKNVENKITFQGDLHIMPMDLTKLLPEFNVKLPAFRDSNALQNISSDIAFNGDLNSVNINPLKLSIDNSNLTGNIAITNFANPAINFKLDLDSFNVDRYLPPAPATAQNNSSRSTTTSAATNTDQPINLPTEMLRKLNIDGTFNISQLVATKLHLNSVVLTLSAHQGLIKLAPIRANLYEGNLASSASIDVRSVTPQYSFATTLSNVQAKDLLADLTGNSLVTGMANFDSAINTQGNTVKELTARLNGNGKFSFTKGVLNGINVNYELARAKAMLGKAATPATPAQNSTDFGQMTGTFQIVNGVVKNNDLSIINPSFIGKGNGTANLNSSQINYLLKLHTSRIPELAAYQIPINISGAFKKPSVNLDMQDILKQVFLEQRKQAEKQLRQQAKDQVNKYLGNNKNAQDLVNNILG